MPRATKPCHETVIAVARPPKALMPVCAPQPSRCRVWAMGMCVRMYVVVMHSDAEPPFADKTAELFGGVWVQCHVIDYHFGESHRSAPIRTHACHTPS
mmetsp:Transcript_47976/g.103932  ORF Transcript_47976/g.103932 Transcript_47976/m.103932 type:complete len:98 (-) Transcript_47976:188-481(-)